MIYEKMCDLSRLALNNPSLETKQLVKTALTGFGNIIQKYHLDSADVDYLVESVPDSRSAFTWRHTPNLIERRKMLDKLIFKLTHFDRVQDYNRNFAQYASDLETLTSALGYRAIGSSVKKDAQTKPSDNMKRLLDDMNKGGYIVPHVKLREFPHRPTDDASCYTSDIPSIEIPQGSQDEIVGGLPGRQAGLPSRKFTLDSIVAKAVAHNIPMRAHISGTAPLTLAGLEFVLNNGEKRVRPDESTLIKLAGIISACYALGDFHSLAETAAGVAHFYQVYVDTMRFSNQNAKILEEVPAKTFYALSFGFLNSIVSDKAMECFNQKTQELLDLYIE